MGSDVTFVVRLLEIFRTSEIEHIRSRLFLISLGIIRVGLRVISCKIGASNQFKRATRELLNLQDSCHGQHQGHLTVAALREYEVRTLYTSQKIQ